MLGFLSTDSPFGRAISRLWIIIITSLMFAVCCLPVFTVGAAYAALYYTMFRMLRSKWEVSPYREFFHGLKANFKQGTICWLVSLALFLFGYLDVRFCKYMDNTFLTILMYLLYAMGIALIVMNLYIYPVMAAFDTDLKGVLKNSLYFAMNRPLSMIVIFVVTVIPQVFTYANMEMFALYGFIWVVGGYSLVVTFCAWLLLKQFSPYLPEADDLSQIKPGHWR